MLAVGRVDPLEVIWIIISIGTLAFCVFCLIEARRDFKAVIDAGVNSAALMQVRSDRRIAWVFVSFAALYLVLGLFALTRVPNPDAQRTGTAWVSITIFYWLNIGLALATWDKWHTRIRLLEIYRVKQAKDASDQLDSGGGVGDRRHADDADTS